LIVDGQMVGAAAQGIAGALLEELPYDRQGQPLSTSFMDYSMPTAVEVPPIAAVALELEHHDPATSNPLGLKGVGEAGIVSAGAAVANAVADALGPDGIRIESIPLTPEAVLAALDA
jgi:carbon-monoxide dehydrogenase large subunit